MPFPLSTPVQLLRSKLALLMGDLCPINDEIKSTHPNALSSAWSTDMSGPHRHVILNNATFSMSEIDSPTLASAIARGTPHIDAGENIKLYLNDVHTRQLQTDMRLTPTAISAIATSTGINPSYWLLQQCVAVILKTHSRAENDDENPAKEPDAMAGILSGFIERVVREAQMLGFGNGDGVGGGGEVAGYLKYFAEGAEEVLGREIERVEGDIVRKFLERYGDGGRDGGEEGEMDGDLPSLVEGEGGRGGGEKRENGEVGGDLPPLID